MIEKPFELEDAYLFAKDHLRARPIARLRNIATYPLWLLATRVLGYQGITKDNYLIASPFMSSDEIVDQMSSQYKTGRNEHLAHTAICDFPGELLALGSGVTGSFTLSNTNHISRVNAIRYFKMEGVFEQIK